LGCSPGQKLLNLRYERYSTRTVVMHFSMNVLVSYFRDRFSQILLRYIPSKRLQRINGLYRLIRLVYHYRFLYFGGYATPIERLLHLRAIHCSPPVLGTMNFDIMNRELIWEAFRDFLLVLLSIKATVQRLWIRWKRRQTIFQVSKQQGGGSSRPRFVWLLSPQEENYFHSTKMSISPSGVLKCVECEQNAISPVRNIACGHIYCYYCFSIKQSCTSCDRNVER
uniref:RING-type E3 ubiquitin transferase (cysteine targeting) n=1 Tax=Parascaris univalens TaxID=6257 RepID=A0A915B5Z9_PARUN